MIIDKKNNLIFALGASKEIGNEITKKLGINLSDIDISRFADGEILIKPKISVRNKEVYIIQSTSPPVNDNLMELLIAIDSIKRGSAEKINVIIPYFGYARQDRKSKGREPITCKLVANILTKAGADRIITIDIHSSQSMGFFDVPLDDLKPINEASEWIFNYLKKNNKNKNKICIVSPDHGGLIRARKIADKLKLMNSSLAVIDKRRTNPNESHIEYILGDVKDKICFLIDDMIDTGGTICNAAKLLKQKHAKEVLIIVTHPILSDPACERLNKLIKEKIINKIVVSNSIQLPKNKKINGLEILSVGDFIADVISTSINSNSISDLYNKREKEFTKRITRFLHQK